MTRSTITDPHAPKPVGPYSHGARGTDGSVFLSGQTPIDPATGQLIDGDVAAQTKQVFANLASVLAAANLTLQDVVKVNVYLIDMNDFTAMNAVYATVFHGALPRSNNRGRGRSPLGRPSRNRTGGHGTVK